MGGCRVGGGWACLVAVGWLVGRLLVVDGEETGRTNLKYKPQRIEAQRAIIGMRICWLVLMSGAWWVVNG